MFSFEEMDCDDIMTQCLLRERVDFIQVMMNNQIYIRICQGYKDQISLSKPTSTKLVFWEMNKVFNCY